MKLYICQYRAQETNAQHMLRSARITVDENNRGLLLDIQCTHTTGRYTFLDTPTTPELLVLAGFNNKNPRPVYFIGLELESPGAKSTTYFRNMVIQDSNDDIVKFTESAPYILSNCIPLWNIASYF